MKVTRAVVLVLLLFLIPITGFAQAWEWMKGAHNGQSAGLLVKTDKQGNVYCSGQAWFNGVIGTVPFAGGGYSDMPLVKYDSAGNQQWAIFATGAVNSLGMAVDPFNNIYILGGYGRDVVHFGGHTLVNPHPYISGSTTDSGSTFIAKVSPEGAVIWMKNLENNNAWGGGGKKTIDIDAAGKIYVAFGFTGAQTLGSYSFSSSPGNADLIVAKFDSSGTVVWARQYGDSSNDWLAGLKLTPSGKIYLVGTYRSPTITFGSTTLVNSMPVPNLYNVFTVLLDTLGYPIWARTSTGDAMCVASEMCVDKEASVIVGGDYFSWIGMVGTTSFGPVTLATLVPYHAYGYVVKYDSLGNAVWGKTIKGKNVNPHGLVVDNCNNVWIFGANYSGVYNQFVQDTIDGHIITAPPVNIYPAFLACLSNSGTFLQASALGVGGNPRGADLTFDLCRGKIHITALEQLDTFIVAGDSLYTTGAIGGTGTPYNLFVAAYDPGMNCGSCLVPQSPVCVGSSITLASTLPAGGAWSSSNPAVASVSSTGIVHGLTAGTTYVTYTNAGTEAFLVKVDPLPAPYTVTGGGAYCAGAAGAYIGLSGSDDGCVSYQLYHGPTPLGISYVATGAPMLLGPVVAPGTYSVAALNSCTGCAAPMVGSVNVSINPVPATFAVTGDSTYCAGYTGIIIGLTGSEGGISYRIYKDTTAVGSPVTGTGSAISLIIPTAVSGVYKIVATNIATGCKQTMADSAVITIVSVAPPIVGPDTVCTGSSIILTNAIASGTWSSASAVVAVGAATGNVAGLSPGTALIIYTIPGGCADTALITVMQGTSPIAGSSWMCEHRSIMLTNDVPGGVWTSSDAAIATVGPSTGIVTGITTGTITISYTLPGGCYGTTTLHVFPEADAGVITGVDTICIGDTAMLYSSIAGGAWFNTLPSVTGILATGAVYGIAEGVDTIKYMVNGDLCPDAAIHLLTVLPTGICSTVISEYETNSILTITPNPAGNNCTITIIGGLSVKHAEIYIYDAVGRTMLTQSIPSNVHEVSLTHIPAGIYYCHITADQFRPVVKKLVVIK